MTIISCYFCGHPLTSDDVQCASCGRTHILRGHFRITRILGKGGFGTVFEVLDQRFGVQRAVKQITTSSLAEQQRIEQEAQISATHAGSLAFIPDIYDIWNEATSTYFAMEYIPGDTLEELVQRDGPWHAADVEHFLHTMLEYFAQMLAHELVHRDIKPANIKRTPDGRYVLLDFGIAKQGNTTQTAHRGVYSRYFASPEQQQSQPTDRRSDLYSLGAVAYYLLTNTYPEDSLDRLKGAPLYPVSDFASTVPLALEHTVLQLLALEPTQRPQNPQQAQSVLTGKHIPRPVITDDNRSQVSVIAQLGDGNVWDVALSPDEDTLAIATSTGIELWDMHTMRRSKQIDSSDRFTVVRWSPDGRTLAAGGHNIRLFFSGGARKSIVSDSGVGLWKALAWHPSGDYFACVAHDRATVKLHKPDGTLLRVIEIDTKYPSLDVLSWSPDGQTLAIGDSDVLQLWNDREDIFYTEEEVGDAIMMLSWNPEGQELVSAGYNTAPLSWKIDGHFTEGDFIESLVRKPRYSSESRALAWSPDGQWLAIGYLSHPCAVVLWNEKRSIWKEVTILPSPVVSITWKSTSKELVVASGDGTVQVLTTFGECLHELTRQPAFVESYPEYVTPLAWSSDSQHIALLGADQSLAIHDADGRVLHRLSLPFPAKGEAALAWSPDNRLVAYLGEKIIAIWDEHGALRKQITTIQCNCIAWSLDSSIVAARSKEAVWFWRLDDKQVAYNAPQPCRQPEIWDSLIETPLVCGTGYNTPVGYDTPVISPDGRTEARVLQNGTVCLYGIQAT